MKMRLLHSSPTYFTNPFHVKMSVSYRCKVNITTELYVQNNDRALSLIAGNLSLSSFSPYLATDFSIIGICGAVIDVSEGSEVKGKERKGRVFI